MKYTHIAVKQTPGLTSGGFVYLLLPFRASLCYRLANSMEAKKVASKNKNRAIEILEAHAHAPVSESGSVQQSLFSTFVANDQNEWANTVRTWDAVPKFPLTPQLQASLRDKNGHADPVTWNYRHRDRDYSAQLDPVAIKQKDGSFKHFFPSVTEELVEEALKKIFLEQNQGFHDVRDASSWVKFTLRDIYRTLKQVGKERNITQIKRALEILAGCQITVYENGRRLYKGGILSEWVSVDRSEYLQDTKLLHTARFPVFISHSINTLGYRQLSWTTFMSFDLQLSRWMHKHLTDNFIQAGIDTMYHFQFRRIQNESQMLAQAADYDNKKKMESVLNELTDKDVLDKWEIADNGAVVKKSSRKSTIDYEKLVYELYPSSKFIAQQKAANKRIRDAKQTMPYVDKSNSATRLLG